MKRFLLFTIAILFIPGICLAATDDTTQTPDKRLEQKVNIKITGMPLGDFLTKLSAKTGVKMSARKDIADDKLAIYVKNLPLSDLQDAVKEVLHLHCTKKGETDKWEYEFWMDLKDKQDVGKSKEKEVKKLQDYMQEQLDDLKLSPEELAKKYKDESWRLEDYKNLTRKSALGVYGKLSKQQLDSLWRGETLTFPGNILPPGVSAGIIAEMQRDNEEFEATQPESTDDNDDDSPSSTFAGFGSITGMQWWMEDEPSSGKPCIHYRLTVTCLMKNQDGTTSAEDGGATEMYFQSDSDMEDEEIFNVGRSETTEALLEKKIKITSDKPLHRYQLLAEIAKQADIDIVSDYFTCQADREISLDWTNGTSESNGPTITDWILRATLSGEFLPLITQKTDLFMLSNLKWPTLRSREIPKHLVARWKEIQKKQGYLGLKEALEISRLSDLQIGDLRLYGLGNDYDIVKNHKLLAFLDSFTPQQWTQAFTKDGLPLSNIEETQYRLLQEVARSTEPASSILRNGVQNQPDENTPELGFEAIRLQSIPVTANGKRIDSLLFGTIRKDGSSTSFNLIFSPDESGAVPIDTEEIIELSKP